jgi:hypothetical protein
MTEKTEDLPTPRTAVPAPAPPRAAGRDGDEGPRGLEERPPRVGNIMGSSPTSSGWRRPAGSSRTRASCTRSASCPRIVTPTSSPTTARTRGCAA